MLKNDGSLISLIDPEGAVAESYRILRTNIQMKDFDSKLQIINVVSASAGEGKSTTLLNIAYQFRQLNKRVLIIDCDLRAPSLHKKLGFRNKIGITDIIAGREPFGKAKIELSTGFDILLSGTKTPYASEMVQSRAMREFLEKMRGVYDMIFIDCPPIGLVSDGILISQFCDGTLLCIANNHDEKRELEHVNELLKQMDVNVLGIVMNKMPVFKKYYGRYGKRYGGYYGYYGSSAGRDKNKKSK